MVSDCDESASVRESTTRTGPPKEPNTDHAANERDGAIRRILSSLLAVAEEQDLPTVCRSIARLQQETETSPLAGLGLVFCPSFPANARRILCDLRFLLDLRVHAARLSTEELRTKSADLEKYLSYTDWEFQDAQVVFRNEVTRLVGICTARVSRFAETAAHPLNDEIRDEFHLLGAANRSERAVRMNAFLHTRIQELVSEWRAPFEDSSIELFQHAANRFCRRVCELTAGIRSSVESLFDFSARYAEWCDGLGVPERFDCLTDRNPSCSSGDAALYSPGSHFRRHLLRNTLRNVGPDLLKCASRAAEDHKNYLEKCCTDLIKLVAQLLSETREAISGVVEAALCRERDRSDFSAAEDEIAKSRSAADTLNQCEGELNLLFCHWETARHAG